MNSVQGTLGQNLAQSEQLGVGVGRRRRRRGKMTQIPPTPGNGPPQRQAGGQGASEGRTWGESTQEDFQDGGTGVVYTVV